MNVDELTQLRSRRDFDDYALAQWTRAMRERIPLSIVLIDVDDLVPGEDVLERVAAAIRSCCRRSTDLAGRIGGAEFAVVLPNTPVEGAKALGQQIRRAVEDVTLSFGCAAAMPMVGDSLPDLIVRAENALYASKLQGQNRVAIPA